MKELSGNLKQPSDGVGQSYDLIRVYARIIDAANEKCSESAIRVRVSRAHWTKPETLIVLIFPLGRATANTRHGGHASLLTMRRGWSKKFQGRHPVVFFGIILM